MSELVAYYDENPIDVKGKVEIHQSPMPAAAGSRSEEGLIRPSVVYVRVPSAAGLLVPFGRYDDWLLRDQYNEAIRIMNTLGAATISCETFGEVTVRRGLRAKIRGRGAELTQQRVENSGFDYQHVGAGSAPRDPSPLRWADEPGFSAAVSSVLENGASRVEINIRGNRTHAVDGTLGIQLKELGFDLGGTTERSATTRLHIVATFPQARKGWRS